MLNLQIRLLTKTAKYPTKAHDDDAAFDIYADTMDEVIKIAPGETKLISTGFATAIPHGYWGAIFARSGLATKEGLRPAQGVPVIDAGYRGEWKIPLHNDSNETREITQGERIAQFMLLPTYETTLVPTDDLDETDRGAGGFGSSGKQ